MNILAPIFGWMLVVVGIADLFLTVLYARTDIGLLTPYLNDAIWRVFRRMALLLPAWRRMILSLAGPFMLVTMLVVWLGLLVIGFALIAWPALGVSIFQSDHGAPLDFVAAIYYSGHTLSTLGYGDIIPVTDYYRMLAVIESLTGFSVLTLSLAYFVSIYSSLARRNTLALMLHQASGGTDDAAELLAHLGPGGDFAAAPPVLQSLSGALLDLYEAYHAYPAIRYFRVHQSFYAFTHIVRMFADLDSLANSTLDRKQYRGLLESAVFLQAGGGPRFILQRLLPLLVPKSLEREAPTDAELGDWAERHRTAVERLAEAGILVRRDAEASREYVRSRAEWEPALRCIQRYMAEMDDE